MSPPKSYCYSNVLCNLKSIFLQELSELFLINNFLRSQIYLKKKSLMLLFNVPLWYSLSEAVASVAHLIILRLYSFCCTQLLHVFICQKWSTIFLYLNILTEESLIFKSRMKCIHKQQFGLLTLEDRINNKKIHSFLFCFMLPSLMGSGSKLKLEKKSVYISQCLKIRLAIWF